MVRSIGYEVRIRVQGELASTWWSGLFADLAVAAQPDGTTLISGELADQTALHGLLATIRDLGVPLVSVETVARMESASGAPSAVERDDGATK